MKKIVVFSADWCGPCKSLKLNFSKSSLKKGADWVERDVDQYPELVTDLDIRGLPTIIVAEGSIKENAGNIKEFVIDKELSRRVGLLDDKEMEKLIERLEE
jgi:thiol-disulfide isomerase/thioredoxin